jgi:hypothetical protein
VCSAATGLTALSAKSGYCERTRRSGCDLNRIYAIVPYIQETDFGLMIADEFAQPF